MLYWNAVRSAPSTWVLTYSQERPQHLSQAHLPAPAEGKGRHPLWIGSRPPHPPSEGGPDTSTLLTAPPIKGDLGQAEGPVPLPPRKAPSLGGRAWLHAAKSKGADMETGTWTTTSHCPVESTPPRRIQPTRVQAALGNHRSRPSLSLEKDAKTSRSALGGWLPGTFVLATLPSGFSAP